MLGGKACSLYGQERCSRREGRGSPANPSHQKSLPSLLDILKNTRIIKKKTQGEGGKLCRIGGVTTPRQLRDFHALCQPERTERIIAPVRKRKRLAMAEKRGSTAQGGTKQGRAEQLKGRRQNGKGAKGKAITLCTKRNLQKERGRGENSRRKTKKTREPSEGLAFIQRSGHAHEKGVPPPRG